jgi:uncharacterized protein
MYQFEWDENKNQLNQRKHGISFQEAKSFFYDPQQIAFYDPNHSHDEDREILIGHSNEGRLLLVICTIRSDKIRIISARKASKQEANDYAEGI